MNSNAALRQSLADVDPFMWAIENKIKLQSGVFNPLGHEYQVDPMQSTARKRIAKKGAQLGWTELEVIRTLHGQIHGQYPSGVLYLFPTSDDVSDFSKARFGPLISDNPDAIGYYVRSTDSTNIKRIGTGMLYLRGARATQKVEGLKKDAAKLRSIPVDAVKFDEVDLMDPDMVDMALERFSHSQVQEEVYLSTPTIPGFGIDKLYQESDQRVWMITCPKCGRECCLELDFPDCVKYHGKQAYRACVKCGEELNPSLGKWVAQRQADSEGYWISQLNSNFVDPGKILTLFNDPPHGNIQEVYNSKLGMAYIAAENRLTVNDVYACCGSDSLITKDTGPCAMGVDVGNVLNVVIGKRLQGIRKKIVYVGRVAEFNDLHELARDFNVTTCVIDQYPETRKVREFRKSEAGNNIGVFGCQYLDMSDDEVRQDDDAGVVKMSRTELCDATHTMIANGVYDLPRRCPEIEEYARQMSAIAKILDVDNKRGTAVYRYKKLGADHYRHATNYFELASQKLPEVQDKSVMQMLDGLNRQQKEFNVDDWLRG